MAKKPVIKVIPPGPKGKKIVARDDKAIATSTKTSPIVAKKATGVYVEDVDGNLFIDFTSGIGVCNIGFSNPRVVKAVKDQAEKLMHFAGTDFYYEIQVKLAEKLAKITPGKFPKKVFFTNSGAESIEAAIKVCKWSTQRKRFIAFIRAFHGRTMGALAFTASKPVHRDRFFSMMPGVTHIPYADCYRCPYKLEYPGCDVWCIKILDEIYFNTFVPPNEVAGLFMEPVQGEGGYIVPPAEFVKEIRKVTKSHDILLVDDEVQAGFGRTGKMFAIEHFKVTPDVMTLAKGLGGGMPIGATVFDAKFDWGVSGAHSNTYGGNLVCSAAALASIETIESKRLIQNAQKIGRVLQKRLKELCDKYPRVDNERGLGLMRAVEFVESKKTKKPDIKLKDRVMENTYKMGLVLLPCGKSSIRFIPPLVMTKDELNAGMDVFAEAVKKAMK
jgi:4-aminobutyrate aminotransferase